MVRSASSLARRGEPSQQGIEGPQPLEQRPPGAQVAQSPARCAGVGAHGIRRAGVVGTTTKPRPFLTPREEEPVGQYRAVIVGECDDGCCPLHFPTLRAAECLGRTSGRDDHRRRQRGPAPRRSLRKEPYNPAGPSYGRPSSQVSPFPGTSLTLAHRRASPTGSANYWFVI
jgi:hypothetical protein